LDVTKERLLIIEDEVSVAKQLKWSFGDDYDVTIADDVEGSKRLLACGAFPVVILDLGLPPSPDTPRIGLNLLQYLAVVSPNTKVIVTTGNSEQDTAVQAVASGAFDFCAKPIDLEVLRIILDRAFRIYAIEEVDRKFRRNSVQCDCLCGILGASPVMQNLFSIIRKVSANDYPVLISGESGTGKEMVAHAIHELSRRSNHPFVIVNCGAIPENLLESELFGHERGAFTGAVAKKIGKLEHGNTGTIFLDEIGELPFAMQVKILRCLQEGTIERVGGTDTISLDIRIVAATNIDLKKLVEERLFREDLYYRLSVVPIEVPSLSERPEDIMVLAQHILREEAKSLKIGRVSFSPDAIAALSSHSWPGNVRELQNRIRRALVIYRGPMVLARDLGLNGCSPEKNDEKLMTLQAARNQSELSCMQRALRLAGNNITQAAKLLDISRPTLHDLIKKHGVKV
jgi:two-component system NtrC family response regulator